MNIANSPGLTFRFLPNGSIKCIDTPDIRISLKPATTFSRSGANIWLRKLSSPTEYLPLLGPESNGEFFLHEKMFEVRGNWDGIEYHCSLQLSERDMSWQWCIRTTNNSGKPIELDLIYVQDIGLKQISDGLVNEYYVSQYIERLVLQDKTYGSVVCCRQNMQEAGGHPWIMLACRGGAASASVDGMQFFGKTFRLNGLPEGLSAAELGGEMAGESSIVALQAAPFHLKQGDHHTSCFIATFMIDHPEATSANDLKNLPDVVAKFGDTPLVGSEKYLKPEKSLLHTSGFLQADDLNEADLLRYFGTERRHAEHFNENLLAFFGENNTHVVLRTKEALVDRPHAHIMQANMGLTPNEGIMSTTSFASGIFNSHLSQGNTNFSVLLSIGTSQFNLEPESGQRIIVEINGNHYLLGVPSAFEMGLNHCRWIYKTRNHCLQVRSWTSADNPRVNMDFKVISGDKVNLLIIHSFDPLNGWTVIPGNQSGEFIAKPSADSMLAAKFPDARFRVLVNNDAESFTYHGDEILYKNGRKHDDNLFIISVDDCSQFSMSFIGEVRSEAVLPLLRDEEMLWLSESRMGGQMWGNLSLNLALYGEQEGFRAIGEILPWYGMNALTHFLTPYGIEQFSGAAWGTRDISQGPFDLLLCMERYSEARQLLRIIFSHQNPEGGWPQWWMFDSFSEIRADSAHGDVVYWCLIALSNYIKVTGDIAILDEMMPYYRDAEQSPVAPTPLSEHVERVINMITDSFIPGTSLVPFGGGDWNDSLQPVSKDLARRMISSWTVEMNYQAFNEFRFVYEKAGNTEKADALAKISENIREDFNRHLIRDGIVAGYGLVEDKGDISLLLHPSDRVTNIQYSILPMNRGIISGIFTKEQAIRHQVYIEKYLKGPDGARLMNRPLKYRGGIQTIFQRAESSTFFGREIGLMYVHEHIRYAESQARLGNADAFLLALRQAIPIEYQHVVPCGDFRQSNCYYSSSDVTFSNRYEADSRYDEIKAGTITLKGGWRIYSSGPGIYISLIITRLLGLRIESEQVILDPVLPFELDGISASLHLLGKAIHLKYSVLSSEYSPKSIIINGKMVEYKIGENKYRKGGAVFPVNRFIQLMDQPVNMIGISL